MVPTLVAVILLAGEPVAFDRDLQPRFTAAQVRGSAESTRLGMARWAATRAGRQLIERFRGTEFVVFVVEDREAPAPGRAPQPGLLTLAAFADKDVVKRYDVILNPEIAAAYTVDRTIDLGEAATAVDVMAAAWAGEMLHVDFYARGVMLPHHERSEFQERWQAVATELGLPRLTHDSVR